MKKLDMRDISNSWKYNKAKGRVKVSKGLQKTNHKFNVSLSNSSSKVRAITLEDVNKSSKKPLYSIGSIVISLLIGMMILGIMGTNPLYLITGLFKGSFAGEREFGNFLAMFSWMLALGLALGVSFKAGIFNIGASSQMMISGMIGYLFAYNVSGLALGWLWAVIFGVITATALALFIGMLKTRFGINEVLSSIMFNWIIFLAYKMILSNPEYSDGAGGTMPIPMENSLRVPWLTEAFPESNVNIGIFLVLFAFVMVWGLYKYSTFGYRSELIGSNESAAQYSGVKTEKTILKTFALSGALAGLAGSIFYLGANQSLTVVTDNIPTEGFQGITIALIGFNSPLGIFGASIFMAMLVNSTTYLSTIVDPNFIGLIQGITIFLIAISHFFIKYDPIGKRRMKRILKRGQEFTELNRSVKAKSIEYEELVKKSNMKINSTKQKQLAQLHKLKMEKLNFDLDISEEINNIFQEYKRKINEETHHAKNNEEKAEIIQRLNDEREKVTSLAVQKALTHLELQEKKIAELKVAINENEKTEKEKLKLNKEKIMSEIKDLNQKIKVMKSSTPKAEGGNT